MAKYQTISEFLFMPFGDRASQTKLAKYKELYLANDSKIILNAHTKIEDSYYFHVKIPSVSQKDANVYYDVVIRFFTDNPAAKVSSNLRDYYIQFFSNSPGFIYNYAVLYRKEGFLIESLYTKMDPRYFDKLPIKANKTLELSYDKSIYFTCRFLYDKKFTVLNKFGAALGKKLSPDKFFDEIKDFQSIQIENTLLNMEKKSSKDITKTFNSSSNKPVDSHRKVASNSTMKSNQGVVRKTATNSTSTTKSVVRKTASKSTVKK